MKKSPVTLKRAAGAACLATAMTLAAGTVHAQEVEFSYGVDITTNFLSKGMTNTDDKAAIQPWAEVGMNGFYLAVWASNTSFDGVEDIELDFGGGYRHSFGNFDLDVGYMEYAYRDDKEDYGEAYVFGAYNFSEQFTAGLKYYYEVYADEEWLYAHASYSGLPHGLVLSGGVGSDMGTKAGYEDTVMAYDLGVSKELNEYSAVDLRVTHSSVEDTRIGAMLSFYR